MVVILIPQTQPRLAVLVVVEEEILLLVLVLQALKQIPVVAQDMETMVVILVLVI